MEPGEGGGILVGVPTLFECHPADARDEDAREARDAGADGIVVGTLRPDGKLYIEGLKPVIEADPASGHIPLGLRHVARGRDSLC